MHSGVSWHAHRSDMRTAHAHAHRSDAVPVRPATTAEFARAEEGNCCPRTLQLSGAESHAEA